MSGVKRVCAEASVLVVVDVQERLLPAIPTAPAVVRNAAFLLDAAALLGVHARATEQYPKGLGPTTPELARRLPQPIPAKTAFSCCGAGTFLEELEVLPRHTVVLCGIETHVCVAQTALDLLEAGRTVFVPVDAVGSRHAADHETALRRLEHAGAVLTTCEAVAFEWVRDSAHPQFKAVSKLVVARGQRSEDRGPEPGIGN